MKQSEKDDIQVAIRWIDKTIPKWDAVVNDEPLMDMMERVQGFRDIRPVLRTMRIALIHLLGSKD